MEKACTHAALVEIPPIKRHTRYQTINSIRRRELIWVLTMAALRL